MQNGIVEELFEVGAHFGFKKSRRHPSVVPFLYGVKNGCDIFDLEKVAEKLEEAKEAARLIGQSGKQILLVGSKDEAKQAIKSAAERSGLPFVIGRWIGGTLTNFKEIRKRVDRLENLTEDEEKGNLSKYTKKERLVLSREKDKLQLMFGGIVNMNELPQMVFVIDPEAEHTAIREANHLGIRSVALAGSNCDLTKVTYPIPANDSALKSIEYFVNAIMDAYEDGKNGASKKESPAKKEDSSESIVEANK